MYKKVKNNKGFTIIEVLIVLAIAALILLIVFLAVPALQRSAKNSQRRTDATALSTAINEYIANNNGSLPNDFCASTAGGTTQTYILTDGDNSTGFPTGSDTPSTFKVGNYNLTVQSEGLSAPGVGNAGAKNCSNIAGGSAPKGNAKVIPVGFTVPGLIGDYPLATSGMGYISTLTVGATYTIVGGNGSGGATTAFDGMGAVNGGTCGLAASQGTANPTIKVAYGEAKNFAVVYSIETGSGSYSMQCIGN
jgi:prepilin-type N-terminal cleavage/methylation domain-containing protein